MALSNTAKIAIGIATVAAAVGIGLAVRYAALPRAPEMPVVPAETSESRDRARYASANEIRIALATYERDFSDFPATLDLLVPKYLAKLPTDPSTGAPYAYEKNNGGYALTFSLEGGMFALSAGEHMLTPRGFDIPSSGASRVSTESETVVQVIPPTDVPAAEPENPLPPPPPEEEIIIDTDGDGLPDDQEPALGSDPNKTDTDDDGLSDYEEAKTYGTDPAKADTDGDGYSDGAEVKSGYDPKGSGKLPAR